MSATYTADEISAWLVQHISNETKVPLDEIDPAGSFVSFGIDSMLAVRISSDLEAWLGRKLPPTLLWDYPSIEALSAYLAENA
jgi:acyl carrier protein